MQIKTAIFSRRPRRAFIRYLFPPTPMTPRGFRGELRAGNGVPRNRAPGFVRDLTKADELERFRRDPQDRRGVFCTTS
jgi:hypothetical protein